MLRSRHVALTCSATSSILTVNPQKLKDDFYADLNSAKSPNEDEHTESSHTLTTPATTASKPKPKLKKKADEDPYASDKDEVQPDPTMETENPIKPTKRLKNYTQDDFESEDDKDEEEEQRKRELKAKKVVSAANKVAYNKRPRDEDENDEELPRKRVGRK